MKNDFKEEKTQRRKFRPPSQHQKTNGLHEIFFVFVSVFL